MSLSSLLGSDPAGGEPKRRRTGFSDAPPPSVAEQLAASLIPGSAVLPAWMTPPPSVPASVAQGGVGPPPMPSPLPQFSYPPRPQQRPQEPQQPKVRIDPITGEKKGPPVAGEDGNWACPECGHVNFRVRRECQKCQTPKPASEMQNDRVDHGEDAIDAAAGAVLQPVAALETELSFDGLRWKVASVFRKAQKGVSFGGQIAPILEMYAEKAFSQLFNTFGDRDWLTSVDFTLVYFAGVKVVFPADLLKSVETQQLETMIVTTYERAFDECRVQNTLWEVVEKKVTETHKKNQNKIYAGLEEGRGRAISAVFSNGGNPETEMLTLMEKVNKFIDVWVKNMLGPLAQANRDDPTQAFPEHKAIEVMQYLVHNNGLPIMLTREMDRQGLKLQKPHAYVNEAVKQAYLPYLEKAAKRAAAQARKQPKTAYCWYFFNGTCGFGDGRGCIYAHSEAEIAPHLVNSAPWSQTPPGMGQSMGKGMGMDAGWGGMGKGFDGGMGKGFDGGFDGGKGKGFDGGKGKFDGGFDGGKGKGFDGGFDGGKGKGFDGGFDGGKGKGFDGGFDGGKGKGFDGGFDGGKGKGFDGGFDGGKDGGKGKGFDGGFDGGKGKGFDGGFDGGKGKGFDGGCDGGKGKGFDGGFDGGKGKGFDGGFDGGKGKGFDGGCDGGKGKGCDGGFDGGKGKGFDGGFDGGKGKGCDGGFDGGFDGGKGKGCDGGFDGGKGKGFDGGFDGGKGKGCDGGFDGGKGKGW